jgi:hypothetical protein
VIAFSVGEFRPLRRNSLLGFLAGRLDLDNGLAFELADLAVHARDGHYWIGWPAKPLIDRDGQVLRDESSGKARYSPPLIRPADRNIAAKVEGAILDALRRAQPEALGGEGNGRG